MFGFGRVDGLNRKEYNNRVRNLLENRLSILTDHDRNPMFPGILVFAQMIAQGWHQKCCPEDNAVFIALSYWSGTSMAGDAGLEEARRIDSTLCEFLLALQQSGKISESRCQQFQKFYDENHHQLQPEPVNETPDYITGWMEKSLLRNDLRANGMTLSETFQIAHSQLATDFGHIGAVELEAGRVAYQSYILARSAGLPTFEMQRYMDATEKLMKAMASLREAFAQNHLDITDIWRPFMSSFLEDLDLVQKSDS